MAETQSADEKPLVSVIVLNYNGLSFLPRCLETLRRTSYPRLELIVVDNCSTDDSVAYLRDHYPDIKLFPLTKNLGFSGAYNAVIPETTGEVIVLLNFDVEVEADWLDQPIALMVADRT